MKETVARLASRIDSLPFLFLAFYLISLPFHKDPSSVGNAIIIVALIALYCASIYLQSKTYPVLAEELEKVSVENLKEFNKIREDFSNDMREMKTEMSKITMYSTKTTPLTKRVNF